MNIEESIIEFKKMIERDKDTLRYWKSDTFGHYDEPIKKLEKDVLISETLLTAYEKEKEKNKKIEIIVNKLMPLAECSYWNYENHTCTHTCRGCDGLNEYNKRTSSGILIDKDRYCRLYEDGNAEKDTKFVSVEDLIKRHLKEE